MSEHKCNRWHVRFKLWLEIDGHPVIGQGRAAMLTAIDENGSIIEAARTLGISYRKIRGAISDMERYVGNSLVKTHRGGGHGGGAQLTPYARELVERYLKVLQEFREEGKFQLKSMESKKLSPNGKICHSVDVGE